MERQVLFALLTHIATGVALFVATAGAMWGFITYLPLSFVAAVAAAVIGLVPGLFMLLIAEGLYVLLEILKEKRRQSELLEKIAASQASPSPASIPEVTLSKGASDEILPDH